MCKKSKTQVEREIEPFTILHNKEVSEIGLKSFVLFLIILPPFEIIDFGSPSRGAHYYATKFVTHTARAVRNDWFVGLAGLSSF